MTRSVSKFTRWPARVAASLSLGFLLSLSVSHDAMAACTPAPTGGDDTVVCDGAHSGDVDLDAGNDKVTVNEDAEVDGNLNGGAGNDLIVINGGQMTGDVTTGTNTGSQNDTSDRIFMLDGTITGGEVQLGSGKNNMFFFMGGTIEPNSGGRGSVEINRGSRNSVLVFDGGTLMVEEGLEFQDGNATIYEAARNPIIYLRSGKIVAEELELVARDWQNGDVSVRNGGQGATGPMLTDVTLIIDPVNSKDADYFKALANAAENGNDETLTTKKLLQAIANAPGNSDKDHKMILEVPEVEFGGGNDKLIFDGAVNYGDAPHNLVLQGEEEEPGEYEITEFEGGDGNDKIIVTGASSLHLGELKAFEHLAVTGGSLLKLSDDDYEFEESVTVDGTSELHLSGSDVVLETEHFELQSGEGSGRLAGLPEHYATFDTGGVLRFGALPGEAADDDDDDDDDDAFAALADDDDGDDDDDAPSAGAKLTINTGASTFVNDGTITTLNGTVGEAVTINGPYTSQGGNLAVDAALGSSGSSSDRLIINGTVAGTTTIYVNNVGGAGALTGQGSGDGIKIVTSGNDAFGDNSFRLAANALSGREEVVAGPYAYRLAVTDDAALLQSDILEQVPAYTTAPSVGQRLVSTGLDTLYKRLGEIRSGHNDGATSSDGLVWVRGHYSDTDVDAKGGFDFSQRTNGVLFGAGGVIAGEGRSRLMIGGFGGYATADAGVDAIIFGAGSTSSVDAESWSFGAYASFYEAGRAGTGLYVDTVIKADFIDFDMGVGGRGSTSSDGDAVTGSAEIGYGFALGGGFVVQPQAQISYTDLTVSSFSDAYALDVSYGRSESLIGRLGVQLQANYPQPGGGIISPYALFNVYSEFEGNNRSDINGVEFASDIGGTWYSAGGGINAQLAGSVSLYGSGEYHFGDVEGWQGTGGVKLNW